MAKAKQNIEELLNSAKAYWVCPVTGKQIDATDTATIEAHKQGLIQKEKEKDIQRQQTKAITMLKKEYAKITKLQGLNEYIANVINIKAPNIDKKNMPVFSVEAVDFANTAYVMERDEVAIKISNLVPVVRTILKNDLRKGIDVRNPDEHFYVVSRHNNPLTLAIFDFQVETRNTKVIKVGVEEKARLDKHPQYPMLRAQLQDIKDELHNLHNKHAAIDSQMEKIRREVLENKVFYDYGIEEPKKRTRRM